jgi:hypothetical protein
MARTKLVRVPSLRDASVGRDQAGIIKPVISASVTGPQLPFLSFTSSWKGG